MRTPAFAAGAILYWVAAGMILAAPEPWDSPHYPAALGIAVLLAAVAGWVAPDRPARWGVIAIVAQLPVLLVRAAPGPLLAVGLLILAAECVPAVAAAFLAARWRRRRR